MRPLVAILLFISSIASAAEVDRTIRVPFDHRDANLGTFPLEYLIGNTFDPKKPTVIYITDAQQFQMQRGLMPQHQAQLFGDRFNVVGIVGRASAKEVQQRVTRADGSVDWKLAWRLLRAEQWVDDIDAVRRDVVGSTGKVMIYGRSGGGFLSHQYLAKYAQHVTRAFTQAAVNPYLEAELHINPDRFAQEIAAADSSLPKKLEEVLARDPRQRLIILKVLQRQNFFVPIAQLAAERARVINELHAGNTALLTELRAKYQVDDSNALIASPRGIGIRVRIFEFYAPVAGEQRDKGAAFSIDELARDIAAPLLALGITPATSPFAPLHRAQTDVFLLAGKRDHTCDYRTQIALASYYPRHRLLIVDDDHVFHTLNDDGTYAKLLQSVLLDEPDATEIITRVAARL
jgi:pimeloyl-ACP methyl ester carboxylesterase